MKKYLYHILFLLVLFLIQNSLATVFSPEARLVPEFLLLAVTVFSLTHSLQESLWYGFAAGFLMEIFSGLFFGADTFGLVLVALAVYLVTRNLTAQDISAVAAVFLVIAATGFFAVATFLFQRLFVFFGLTAAVNPGQFFPLTLVWTAVVNATFFYPVKFFAKFLPRDEGPF